MVVMSSVIQALLTTPLQSRGASMCSLRLPVSSPPELLDSGVEVLVLLYFCWLSKPLYRQLKLPSPPSVTSFPSFWHLYSFFWCIFAVASEAPYMRASCHRVRLPGLKFLFVFFELIGLLSRHFLLLRWASLQWLPAIGEL